MGDSWTHMPKLFPIIRNDRFQPSPVHGEFVLNRHGYGGEYRPFDQPGLLKGAQVEGQHACE